MKAGLALTAAVCAMVAFAGCSKPATPGDPGVKKIKVAGVILQEDQFFRMVVFGMRDAAQAAGVELLEGNSAMKPEKEIELVNTYSARGVDAILVSPVSKKGSVTALKLARDKGITIVTFNSTIDDASVPASFVECSAEDLGVQTGKVAREYIEKKLGGKAKVATLEFMSQVPEQCVARKRGFQSQLEGMPGVEYVVAQDAWMPEMAVKKTGDILTAHPEVNVVWAANEGGTVGAVMAVKNAGKAGQVVVFGTDSSDQLVQFLKSDDNILQAITSQRPYDVGYKAVEFAVKAVNKEPVDKQLSMLGICLRRDDPEGIKQFEAMLNTWQGK